MVSSQVVAPREMILSVLLGGGIVWAYWPVFGEMLGKWVNHPYYSHAWLVPAFAVFLLYRSWRGGLLVAGGPTWSGLIPLLLGVLLRLLGAFYFVSWLEMLSLLPVLWGVALLWGGRAALRWSFVAIGFLVFMFPLPHRVETGLSAPLQQLATGMSVWTLQSLGMPAYREGNVIVVSEYQIGIVEACSGLGMLWLFFALTTGLALLSRRPWPDRLLLLVSAIPISLLANSVRIVVTSVLYESVGKRWGDLVFHDLAGWLMMPLALAMLWVELKALSFLLIEVPREEGLPPLSFAAAKDGGLAQS